MSERNVWPGILLTLFVVGLAIWLLALARQGDRMAIAVLAVIAAVVLILVGWGFSTMTNAMNARREQRHFQDNVQENLTIMAAMQKVQNQQNSMLLKQARDLPKALPAPEAQPEDLWSLYVPDESVFDNLDD